MPRMRVEKVVCAACQHYTIEGISHRCTIEGNEYNHRLGLAYHEHPDQKNYNGRCKDYDEKTN